MKASAAIKPVYAVVGNDRFLRSEAVGRLLRSLEGEADEMGPTTFDGERAELADVLDEVRTMSLLGGRRLVVVDEADDFVSKYREKLENYVAAPADGGVLVLVCSSMPKTTRLHKAIAAGGEVVVCEAPKRGEVAGWIVQRSKSVYGKVIDPAVAARLRDHIGDVLGALDAELGKLASYVGPRPAIVAADIDALVGYHREETVFAVVDAMAIGDARTAMGLWDQVLATDRAAPGRAIAGLAYGVRKSLAARREMDGGASIGMIAKILFTSPDIARERMDRVSTRMLEDQLSDLCEADAAIKSGAATLERAIEEFIVTHASRARSARQSA
jgi:DNA polymerase-3 subunit delta